ncbi:uncharacterized protein TNIN_387611 [Trichonephila inaurata madagascariensis]|uniref:Uncharacterized protein n=1 Tax=Trichonephila inaurata madagascariensis TaxID=2747483 RepID=A0A8X6YQ53_9ARAC|nr:uncharacterized protein TNIN_387611 [Trichonephila inaurata madagascariensis]
MEHFIKRRKYQDSIRLQSIVQASSFLRPRFFSPGFGLLRSVLPCVARKGLTIPEALEVFHNLPSDIESDESSLSEAEDVMTSKSSSSENNDIDEEKDDISVPGPSRISKVTWKNKASVKIRNIPFTERSGPSDEITSLQGNIHLKDNNLMRRKSEKNFDKLYKVRPLLITYQKFQTDKKRQFMKV